ncbi:hypothetical protein L1787_18100 [Acuticoccus sp. M5D2P5]|uniref:hypothetical protein n=1 Tax=Acuticoccus kalidii TaxID=2910977 RepID=UPI001F43DF75|nr:hypothetical protein [Acuticoccus kalidii]MCF3935310.1 hypothetical protein [Acuticoccus kalidii]
MNPLDPKYMTTRERLATVCTILACGIVRLRQREREGSALNGDFPLHSSPAESGHAPANPTETA